MSCISREDYLRYIKENNFDYIYFGSLTNRESFSRFSNDREIVLEAVKRYGGFLVHTSIELRNDKEIVLSAVKENGRFLEYAGDELKKDKKIVLEAIKKKGWNLEYASDDSKSDKEVVLEAVKKDGDVLKVASEELKNDPKFVCDCISSNINASMGIGTRLIEVSPLAKMMKHNDFETAFEEFEIEEFKTKRKRNEVDQLFVEVCHSHLKKNPHDLYNQLRRGMELVEKLKEKNTHLHTDEFLDGKDDWKCLKRLKFELFFSDRNLYEKVREWKIGVRNLVSMNKMSDGFCPFQERAMRKRNQYDSKVLRDEFNQKNIIFKDLAFFRVLGRGAFGSTYLCKIKGYPGLYVVKLYQCQLFSEVNAGVEKDSLYLEDHPNTAPILFHRKNEEIDLSLLPDYENYWKSIIGEGYPIYTGGMIVMKYHKISLQKWVNYRMIMTMNKIDNMGFLLPKEFGTIVHGILLGVQHLHTSLIVHRDLHPGNIFVHSETGSVWIGDFGCCLDLRKNSKGFRVHKNHEILYSVSGSRRSFNKTGGVATYSSPEILNYDSSEDGDYLDYSKSDLYSCGVLAKELFDLIDQDCFDEEKIFFWSKSYKFLDFVSLLLKDFGDRISIDRAVEMMNDFGDSFFETGTD